MDGAKITSLNFSHEEWQAIKTAFLQAERERLEAWSVSGNEGHKLQVTPILDDVRFLDEPEAAISKYLRNTVPR